MPKKEGMKVRKDMKVRRVIFSRIKPPLMKERVELRRERERERERPRGRRA